MNNKYAMAESATLSLKDANGEPIFLKGDQKQPVTVTVYSKGTMAYARAETNRQNRAVARMKRKGSGAELSAEEAVADSAAFLSDCTHSMSNIEEVFGQSDLMGAALHRAVYSDLSIRHIVSDPVAKFINDEGNFPSGSATS